jgi:anti-sigma factor RsiW
MCEGYHSEDDDADSFLDEFLCEYVDGTMDPTVREVFEEYLRMNPRLAEQVRCLCQTRQLLCSQHQLAPQGFQDRLRRRVACEVMRSQMPMLAPTVAQLSRLTHWTSAMMVLVLVGMLAGVTLVLEQEQRLAEAPPPPVPPLLTTPVTLPDVPASPWQTAALTRTTLPLYGPASAAPRLQLAGTLRSTKPHFDSLQTGYALARSGRQP